MLHHLLAITTSLSLAVAVSAADTAAYATATASLTDQAVIEYLPGTVQADVTMTLMARVPGQVTRIAAVPGTAVAAGAELATIDAQEIVAKRDQALASVLEAKAAVAEMQVARQLAERDLARARQLRESGTIPQAEFDTAEARAASAVARVAAIQARVTTAEAAVSEATTLLGYTRLTTPFAAVVVKRFVEQGDLLSPGRPVVTLEDPTSLRFVADIPESLASGVTLGRHLRVTIPAAALDQDAEVVEVVPAADPISRTVRVKLACTGDAKACTNAAQVRSGQFGRVAVPVATRRVLTVPAAAVVQRGQLDAVFVVDQGTARMRLIRLGERIGDRIAVRAGLADGDTVVTSGADTLTDGATIK
jgi:RND family efflux transporter MFP subunit